MVAAATCFQKKEYSVSGLALFIKQSEVTTEAAVNKNY